MKILVVTNLYPPYYHGGYEVRCAQVTEALKLAGHDMVVLTSTHGLPVGRLGVEERRTERINGVLVHRWLHQHIFAPYPVLQRPWTILTAKRELADARRFIDLTKNFRPDVVNWWSMYGLAKVLLPLPSALGVPDIHWIEHWWMIAEYGPAGEIPTAFWQTVWDGEWGPRGARPLLRLLGRAWEQRVVRRGIPTREFGNRPAHVCFVSEHLRALHREAGFHFDSSEIIHGGVPEASFYQPLAERRPPGTQLRLLYAGQLTEDRGLHTVIEALGLLDRRTRSGLSLSVAGGGRPGHENAYETQIRDRVSCLQLGDHVTFLGRVPYEAMARTYKEHDLLIFPSMRDEGLPLTMVEAMLAGCAIVTTGSGGAMEVATAADLPLFPKGDAVALSGLLASMVANPQEVVRLAFRGQQVARSEFSFERMMGRWTATLNRVHGNTRRGRSAGDQ